MKSLVLCGALACAAAAIETPRFASGSISPSHSASRSLSMHVQFIPQPVQLTMNNVTLKFCLEQAYAMTEHQIFGPGWIKSARYDVAAALPDGRRNDEVWPAFQALLEERFKLSLRRESRMLPVYALTVSKGGSKLQPARDRSAKSKDPVLRGNASGTVDLENVTMKAFCHVLSRRMDRMVVDETGIAGAYDIALRYEQGRDRSGIAIFSAVQRQLGLKLEARNEPVETLTVKSAQR